MNKPIFHLAIDTSTSIPTVAILNKEKVILDWHGPVGPFHGESILMGLDACLEAANIEPELLQFISVGIGPGGFTGLRIGLATIKTFADIHDLPVASISSLQVLAKQAFAINHTINKVWAVSDAKCNAVYAGLFEREHNRLIGKERMLRPERFASLLSEEDFLIGEGALSYRTFWPFPDQIFQFKAISAASLGLLGLMLYKDNTLNSAIQITAKYLKLEDHETKNPSYC